VSIFHRRSKWQRMLHQATAAASVPAVKTGLTALASVVGLTAASAAISARRQKSRS
jgi:hypothetical protein